MTRRRSIVAALVMAALAALVAIRLVGDGGDTSPSSYVSFDTADVGPDWSPNGRLIAFATNRATGGIYLVQPNGSAMRPLFRGEASDVDWSPDGKAIAFTGRGGIYLVRLHDGRTSVILRGSAFSLPAWAPNGRELAVVKDEPSVFPTANGPIETTSPAIYLVWPDGSHLRRMLPRYEHAVGDARPGSVAAVSESGPAWSPDGKRIAFETGDDRVVVAEVKSGRRILTIQRRSPRDRGSGLSRRRSRVRVPSLP